MANDTGMVPVAKRQKIYIDVASSESSAGLVEPVNDHAPVSESTSKAHAPFDQGNLLPSVVDLLTDINNYIPAGCLRLERNQCGISAGVWEPCTTWQALTYPYNPVVGHDGKWLPTMFQEALLSAPLVKIYRDLLWNGWIRLEFKTRDADCGQVRVYILPDDVGRCALDRNDTRLRRALHNLISELDIGKDIWVGEWSSDTPVAHINSVLDINLIDTDEPTLFQLFNTLPSPTPDLSAIKDGQARDAICNLLSGTVEGLTTTMLPYQRRSAALMLQRETQPQQSLDPRLRELVDHNGLPWYCDTTTGGCLREPRRYDSARGGILAETMGLGKTLICLALILATKDYSSQIPVEYSIGTIPVRKFVGSLVEMSAATVGRTGTPWKKYFRQARLTDGIDYSQCVDAIHRNTGYYEIPGPLPRRVSRNPTIAPPRKVYLTTATLVVVPTNLVRQWEHEIKKHTTGLKVLVMSRLKLELPCAKELAEYDIILFSRQRFEKESKDGSDSMGRRATSGRCKCPVSTKTGKSECDCFKSDKVYRSPLRDLHFKRLIIDEGHTMGNSSGTSKTNAVVVVDFLQLSSRWIVSGTPTPGLYGEDSAFKNGVVDTSNSMLVLDSAGFQAFDTESASCQTESTSEGDIVISSPSSVSSPSESSQDRILDYEQERKDLEKLGNIATTYLKSRPWSNSREDSSDSASWSQYVMQPRHRSKSQGNTACLQATMEGMIIRHRPEDVEKDIELPPLHQKMVYLEGSLQDKISINLFALMINSNAVTSERKDTDYLFHPRQRKALGSLVANLRQASFFWSGFTKDDVQFTINIAKTFLEKGDVYTTEHDRDLLREAIDIGTATVSNQIWLAASENHEMPSYVDTNFTPEVRQAWALDGKQETPTLFGATQLRSLQKLVNSASERTGLSNTILQNAGLAAIVSMKESLAPIERRPSKMSRIQKKLDVASPGLAGGVKVGEDLSPRKKQRLPSVAGIKIASKTSPNPGTLTADVFAFPTNAASRQGVLSMPDEPINTQFMEKYRVLATLPEKPNLTPGVLHNEVASQKISHPHMGQAKQILTVNTSQIGASETKLAEHETIASERRHQLDSDVTSPTEPSVRLATLVSTASSKLSYLLDQVLRFYREEKIIIFYETDNVAYYIAQALEALNVEHLIYAKSLSAERRSQYIVTFNSTPKFRCLLMEISQAAFGLDVSSASRVYFVNPVFNKQIEAQAVKRAHRIGQLRPVYVETLILRSSIEEMIIERRTTMTNDEQKKCQNMLDDDTMYDWIKNVRFIPLPKAEMSGPEQMTKLETPQPLFGRGSLSYMTADNPDAGLVLEDFSPTLSRKAKGKRKAVTLANQDISLQGLRQAKHIASDSHAPLTDKETNMRPKKRAKKVGFLIQDDDTDYASSRRLSESTSPQPFERAESSKGQFSCTDSPSPAAGSPLTKADKCRLDAKSLIVKFRLSAADAGSSGSGPCS